MYRITAALTASLIAFGGASVAQTTLTFNEIDTDGNGKLSSDELEAAFGEEWETVLAHYDDNEDEVLTAEEISGADAPEEGDAVTFADLDTNQDGVLDEEELAEVFGGNAGVALAKFDQNGDGYVTKDEVRSSDDPVGERGKYKWGEAGPGNGAPEKTDKDEKTADRGKDRGKDRGADNGKGKGPKN